jgi:DUF1365 family protein
VSPFIDMAQRYHFRIRPPGERLTVRILETDREGPLLSATFSGTRRGLTTFNIVKTCAYLPLMTLKVVAGIHWEALKLWLKGIRLVERPAAPAPASFDAAGQVRMKSAGARPADGASPAPDLQDAKGQAA